MKLSITMCCLVLAFSLHTMSAGRLEKIFRQVSFGEELQGDAATELMENNQNNKTCVECGPKRGWCECNCHSCHCEGTCRCHMEVGVDIMLADEEPHRDCSPELSLEFHVGDKTFPRDVTVGNKYEEDEHCFKVDGKKFCFLLEARIRRRSIIGKVRLTKPHRLYFGRFRFPL